VKIAQGLGWGGREATGRVGARSNCKKDEWDLLTAVEGIYTFITRSLRIRSGISGKPGHFGKNPETPLPLRPASRFSRNLILDRFGRLYM
jgi:hypothetical protein